jgi:hypothetical protein
MRAAGLSLAGFRAVALALVGLSSPIITAPKVSNKLAGDSAISNRPNPSARIKPQFGKQELPAFRRGRLAVGSSLRFAAGFRFMGGPASWTRFADVQQLLVIRRAEKPNISMVHDLPIET